MPARVVAQGWGWRHAGRRAWALRDLDLVVEPEERVLLLGASGAGKSTLVHALAGVLGGEEAGEEQGRLTLDGLDPRLARGRAGLVLQDPDSQVILARVGDDVAFGCENLGVPREQIWTRVHDALDAVGLALRLDHPTVRLSGGQQQRLALAGVLAMQPGLLLLDEPTANLDPDGVRKVRDAVERVLRRTAATLVVVEHRIATWLPLVDRVVVLGPAGVLADGSPAEVLAARGRELAAGGVWVPGHPPSVPTRKPARDAETLLSAEDLTVGREGRVVRSELEVALTAGSSVALTGANGVGKSTLALTLAGLLPPLAGRVRAAPLLAAGAGPDPHRWRSRELVERVGVVFQEPEHQFLTSSVQAELEVGLRATRRLDEAGRRRAGELLERLRLSRLARANPFTLSGGEKRRLSVATVLATSPSLLVLDEPTFGQDALTWAELVRLLGDLLDEGRTVLSVTHDLDFVTAVADTELALLPAGGLRTGQPT
ncbi:ABC transporter ATP-binding protein [uncultured Friedmanniella sp.]|uniref:ABC transporter ATP-binding protein n=1 Tax=uncultured Friedmanniella sp. TaxID=335381 RepID=UPI0035C972D3